MTAARGGMPTVNLSRLIVTACWASAALVWTILLILQNVRPTAQWLLDWHVYAAGGRDFLDGTLYTVPLESSYRLPIGEFNNPPLSAISVIPLLLLPDAVGGTAWVVLNLLAMAGTTVLAARMLGAHQPMLWAGVAFLAYTVHPWLTMAFLGNNAPLVLFLVTAFAHENRRGRERSAGALLGAAIALKLWPVALIPVLLRERRWIALWSTAAATVLVAVATLGSVGFGALGPAVQAMQAKAVIEPDNPVFYISWLRTTQEWWPWWGGYVVAVVLAAIPARGLLGVALGIFAGLALIPNLWRTYAPTLLVAALFAVRGINQLRGSLRKQAQPQLSVPDQPARAAGVDPPQ